MNQQGLVALEAQIEQDLRYLNIPISSWALPLESIEQDTKNPMPIHQLDVAIIGAGMSGVAAAFALRLKGIHAVVFDAAKAGNEGPWIKPALMQTLRSPKQVLGPAMASPSLSFQAWFLAQYGEAAWQTLDKIPRLQWGEYLQWYKNITQADVRNEHQVVDIKVLPSGSELRILSPKGEQHYFARYVVLAMGMESFSVANIPEWMHDIPKAYWEHSYAGSDYRRFQGKDIGVVGYSAGAMDSSATALENGAKSVEILIRADDMPRVNRGKVAGSAGFTSAYEYFSDAQKWHYSDYVAKAKTPAPHGSTLRVSQHSNAHFNFNSPIKRVSVVNNQLHIDTGHAVFQLDYLILATGYRIDWHKNDAFAKIAPFIKTWQDAYPAPENEQNSGLASHPYLGRSFQLQSKADSILPGIERLYCFNLSASVSMGPLVGLIPGTNIGAEKIAQHIASQLYVTQFERHMTLIRESEDNELLGDEWTVAKPYGERLEQAVL